MKLIEEKVSGEIIYSGKIIDLHLDTVKLPTGNHATREVVEHPGGVGILAVDSENHVRMVRQYRYGAKKTLLEIPAGKLEKGENPASCAARELKEETGLTSNNLDYFMQIIPTPAYCSEHIYIYLATDLSEGEQSPDEDEIINAEKVPFDMVLRMCIDGEITDAKTVAAIFKYALIKK